MIRKLMVAIIIIAFVSLSVSGCTSPVSNPSPSSPGATTQHNATLASYLDFYKQNTSANSTITAWEVTWKNNTAATVEYSYITATANASNVSVTGKEDFTIFASTGAATAYFDSINKTGYSLYSTTYERGGAYETYFGHPPSIFKDYRKNDVQSTSSAKRSDIGQLDNIVVIANISTLAS